MTNEDRENFSILIQDGLSAKKLNVLRRKIGKYPRGTNRIIWTEDPDVTGKRLKAYQAGWLKKYRIGEACYISTKDNLVQGETGVGGGFVGFFIKED